MAVQLRGEHAEAVRVMVAEVQKANAKIEQQAAQGAAAAAHARRGTGPSDGARLAN